MQIETANKIAILTLCLGIAMFTIGVIFGLSGSSFGLLVSFGIGIVNMMIHEWIATYIEEWYDDCDDEKM